MTLSEVKAVLETTGFPVAYRYHRIEPSMPYICYMESYSNNFAADNTVYLPVKHIQIELYTGSKSPEAEETVEHALNGLFFWDKTETYIESEKCYQVIYEIEV